MLVPYLVSLALAFLVETLTEYIFGTPMDKMPKLTPYKWALMYMAAGFGVGLAFYYQLDFIQLIQLLAGVSAEGTPVGMLLTGLGIGRGANWVHQFASTYFPSKGNAYG